MDEIFNDNLFYFSSDRENQAFTDIAGFDLNGFNLDTILNGLSEKAREFICSRRNCLPMQNRSNFSDIVFNFNSLIFN
jgi:hypothetical protein